VEDAAQAEADASDARLDVAKEAVLQGQVSLPLVGIYLAMFNNLPTQGLPKRILNQPWLPTNPPKDTPVPALKSQAWHLSQWLITAIMALLHHTQTHELLKCNRSMRMASIRNLAATKYLRLRGGI